MTQSQIAKTTTKAQPATTRSSLSNIHYATVSNPLLLSDFSQITEHMFALMLRNVASDGWLFEDPNAEGQFSRPGCIIASPSYPANLRDVDQNYVYNWTRDSAITAMELAAANMAETQTLIDYVNFAQVCQNSGASIGHACFTIEGYPRCWSEQSDGPALQTMAIVRMYPQLDSATQATADAVVAANINYLLGAYDKPTKNDWEESDGLSLFARAVQLRCFREFLSNTAGIPTHDTARINQAIAYLSDAIGTHWDNGAGHYRSILSSNERGYDLNADIIMASVYGAIDCADTKLLASAAQLRTVFSDPASAQYYPINGDDLKREIGPMIGRYPGDTYDGDVSDDQISTDHPWVPCSCNLAELYYNLAKAVDRNNVVPSIDRCFPGRAEATGLRG